MPRFFTSLYRGTPAQFASPLSVADAALRLRQLTSCTASPMLRECISGTVDDEGNVCLWREIYQWRNSFAPRYYGALTERDGTTYLEGAFKPALFTRAFMAFVLLFMATAMGVLAYLMVQMQAWPFLVGLVVVALLVVGIAAMGRSASSQDPAAISQTIRQALAGTDDNHNAS